MKDMIKNFSEEIRSKAATPAVDHLFQIADNGNASLLPYEFTKLHLIDE